MAIFEAAERHWIQGAGDVVDEQSAAEFNRVLHRGLQLAATGWTAAPTSTDH